MKKFHLQIQEHQETGDHGISILRSGRDYFDPAFGGFQLAHDILEHPATPHPNGYIDELMALGGVIAGRIENGWMGDRGQTPTIRGDIHADIYSLAMAAYSANDDLCPKTSTRTVRDGELLAKIRQAVEEGLEDAREELEPGELSPDADTDSIVGWICEGYHRYKKRFGSNTYDISTFLFDRIARVCGDWEKGAELGYTATLRVDFTRLDVRLEPEYE